MTKKNPLLYFPKKKIEDLVSFHRVVKNTLIFILIKKSYFNYTG